MKYSVKIIRHFYNEGAERTRKQVDESFFKHIDDALTYYNSAIIGERISSELHSHSGSTNYYLNLIARNNGDCITLESVFIHNGEVMQ